MVTMNFTPYISVGAIKFGEAREEVRKTLGTFKAYKKNKFSANTLDDFGFCQVFYNVSNMVEAVEVYRNAEIIYNSHNLFNLNKQQLINTFQGADIVEDEYGMTIPSLGLAITFIDNLPDSILAYQKGYM